MMRFLLCIALALTFASIAEGARAGSLQHSELQQDFKTLAKGLDGRAGICALDATGAACVNGDQRFSLQSVMKLIAGLAVMDAAERGALKLDDAVIVHRQDLSLNVQPLAALVGENGYRTTIDELVRRAIVDSDSTAVDILIRKLGGTDQVQAFLDRKKISGVRIDRDERHLQTEIAGLTWRPEYVDAHALDKAIASIPDARRTEAYKRYQADIRDTATPRDMAKLLYALASGKLLSTASTRRILDIMQQTATGPDRLKAGLSQGWILAHKTGTSGSWQGVTAATNDVGVLKAPDGGIMAVVVFIGDSKAPAAACAKLMAKVSAAIIAQYR